MTRRWLTRDDLCATARTAGGLLLMAPDAGSVMPLTAEDTELTRAALRAAGIGGNDRVMVALAEPAGPLWAQAAAGTAAAAASIGPRGRLRLHHALRVLGATALVSTPTGAMDLLARLHLEFLLDPLDLGLRQLILTGEIATKRTLGHLAGEFGAEVTEVYASPFHGGALAWRSSQSAALTPLTGSGLGLAAPGKDHLLPGPPYPEGLAELVIARGETVLRTGQVARVGAAGEPAAPEHTVGEHVLVRGVWLSLARVESALSRIDGVATWNLTLSRPGTLDAATLTVTFGRASLVGNPMWRSRIQETVRSLTPVSITVEVAGEIAEAPSPGTVTDLRGHHLGRDRTGLTG
ncbi:acyl-CoA synthetase family protein [Streptosporangium soli]|nr:hypothetical protein [Streptosporangium sp. KLBMP 9127]